MSNSGENSRTVRLEINLNLCIGEEWCETPEKIEEWLKNGAIYNVLMNSSFEFDPKAILHPWKNYP
jgi:hypothetical protein